MQNLFLFLKKTFPFILFIFLEGVGIFFTAQNNKFHNASWNNSSSRAYSYVFGIKQGIKDYFGLKVINLSLAKENEHLKNEISNFATPITDTTLFLDSVELLENIPNSKVADNFNYLLSRVVGNSSNQKYNYITLDKGHKDGIIKGMGVVDRNGIVGMTVAVSENNTLAISLLNIKATLSVKHIKSGGVGMMRWEGSDEDIFYVSHVNKNFEINPGDTIVTSGYSSYFPPDYPVGVVLQSKSQDPSSFQKLEIRTFNSIGNADFVYILFNNHKPEIDSLLQIVK